MMPARALAFVLLLLASAGRAAAPVKLEIPDVAFTHNAMTFKTVPALAQQTFRAIGASKLGSQLGVVLGMNLQPSGPRGEAAAQLAAVHRAVPALTGAAVVSFARGDHDQWLDVTDGAEPALLADMINAGLALYDKKTPLSFDGRTYHPGYELDGLAGLLGKMGPSAAPVLERVEDRHLGHLVNGMAEFAMAGRGLQKGRNERILALLRGLPPDRVAAGRALMSPKVREFVDAGGLGRPAPALVLPPLATRPEPRVPGAGTGRLVIVPGDVPAAEALSALPSDAIAALSVLPDAGPGLPPLRGLLTFRDEGPTSHAQTRARALGIPHALWPGAESLRALEGRRVTLAVTPRGVSLEPAAAGDGGAPAALARVEGAPIDAAATALFVPEGHPDMSRPEVVSHKAAELNRLAAEPFASGDPRVDVAVARGAALPYAAFRKLDADARASEDWRYRERAAELDRLVRAPLAERLLPARWSAPLRRARIARAEAAMAELASLVEGGAVSLEPVLRALSRGDVDRLIERGAFVRGASNFEDLPGHPGFNAGRSLTAANVRGWAELKRALARVLARTAWGPAGVWERAARGVAPSAVVPVAWLLPAYPFEYSFVLHTTDPALGPGKTLITLAQGLGEAIVGSDPVYAGAPTKVVWDRASGAVAESAPSGKTRRAALARLGGVVDEPVDPAAEFLLQPDAGRLSAALGAVAAEIERRKGAPQEVEGGLLRRGDRWTIMLLQSRSVDKR